MADNPGSPIVPNIVIKRNKPLPSGDFSPLKKFSLNDYEWTGRYDGKPTLDEQNVPVLILRAFQPIRKFYPEIIGALFQAELVTSSLDGFLNKLFTELGPGAQIAARLLATNPDKFWAEYGSRLYDTYKPGGGGGSNQQLVDGYSFIKDMFLKATDLETTFILPFLSDRFMEAPGAAGWEDRSLSNVSDSAAKVSKFLVDRFGINMPLQPSWAASTVKTNAEISYKFYLINKDSEALQKNFQFIASIVPHCHWSQLGLMQQPPSIFQATVPGRLMWKWAALSVDVAYAGRTRQFGDFPVPDLYEVSVTLRNLCPNNLNAFLGFFGDLDSSSGQSTDAMMGGLATNLVGEAFNMVGQVAGDVTKSISDAVKKFSGGGG